MLGNEVEVITIINRTTGELWFKINGQNEGLAISSTLLQQGTLFPVVSMGFPGEETEI